MIQIYKNFYITADSMNYIVCKPGGIDKKTGEQIYLNITYHATLSDAVNSIIQRVGRDILDSYGTTIKPVEEYCKDVRKVVSEIEKIIPYIEIRRGTETNE